MQMHSTASAALSSSDVVKNYDCGRNSRIRSSSSAGTPIRTILALFNVGIRGDTIVVIGDLSRATAATVIDATGLGTFTFSFGSGLLVIH